MKPLSFKITSDRLLLCLFLCLQWVVTDSNTSSAPNTTLTATVTDATESNTTSSLLTTPMTMPSTKKTSPRNAEGFKSVGQNETAITLQWRKVDDILNYKLVYNEEEINITASVEYEQVTHTISDLRSGTQYDFNLLTVFENVRSSGVNLTVVTAPENVKSVTVLTQNESSISLMWDKVNNASLYILQYDISGSTRQEKINASHQEASVTHVVSSLTAGTKYNFTFITVFQGDNSTGYKFKAVTAPYNAEGFKSVGQNETAITLQWRKVDDILNYKLVYNEEEINITASVEYEQVTHTISDLRSGTQYDFNLLTVFENVRSSRVNLTVVTATEHVKIVTVLTQNESSISLMWDKVNNASLYILQYDISGSTREEKINASHQEASVTHVVSSLTAGTKYNFTLITVFQGDNSTGYKFKAVTAPYNAEGFKSVGQNETAITLQWRKVDDILNYKLVYNEEEINITASVEYEQVTHTISDLRSGTQYNFNLLTVFENVRSSGVNLTVVTATENVKSVTVLTQNESSISLMWDKVNNASLYILQYDISGSTRQEKINASHQEASVTHVVSSLTAGTKYNFTLITVFQGDNSTGYKFKAVTAPYNAEGFKSVGQNETAITLHWRKVDDILNYKLVYNEEEINITASVEYEQVTHTISDLRSGTQYDFSLLTVFENVRSSGVNLTVVTAPENVKSVTVLTQNESSISLMWDKVNNASLYILQYDISGSTREEKINASHQEASVTHVVSSLTAGTKYNFTLITVFRGASSTGYNFKAVTAPYNAEGFKSVGQNETAITLQWRKVDDILNYKLVYNEEEINITAPVEYEQVTHTISDLRSGTQYDFSLLTVFENVRSSGVNLTVVTAPENVKSVTVLTQKESSISLMWDKVNNASLYILRYDINGSTREEKINASHQEASVTHVVSSLTAGTKYNFTLITVFRGAGSTGYKFKAVTVPSMVSSVSVTERSVTSVNLKWDSMDKDWSYLLQIDGIEVMVPQDVSSNVSYSVTSLKPGKEYNFSVTTMFSGLNSTAYESFIVTAIDCTSVAWHVTNSSIQGMVEGLFSNATATNKQTHVSPRGSNVSFAGLCPGATYEVSLVYERHSTHFVQCRQNLTILPPNLIAHCEYWGAGYYIFIAWNKPDGVWTAVEVNVSGQYHKITEKGTQQYEIPGFLPAKTYEVSVASLSGNLRSSEPFVFLCSTDPRGVIAGSIFAVLLFGVLVYLAVFILLKRPDLIRKKPFIGGSKLSNEKSKAISVVNFPDHFYQLSVDDNRGFNQEYEDLVPVGTEQTRKAALLPENKEKNRFSNVLPYDCCRVKLNTSNRCGTSDYINASYMPGYKSNRDYIATQGPLPSTVSDFWRMIWEQRVKGIVMVTNCTEGGRTKCERYWPVDNRLCHYGELLVTIRSEQKEPNWTLSEISVKHANTLEERTVKHFHFTAWPDHGVPECTEVLIQFRRMVRWHIEREGAGAPTVVHCSAGVGRTGTIIALDVLLQQLDQKRAVGINTFVHKMRLCRPYMVQTESQYVFLHQCIMDYLQAEELTEERIYENGDAIYVNATALQEFLYHNRYA